MQFEASESREGKDDLYGNVAESETSLPVDVYVHDSFWGNTSYMSAQNSAMPWQDHTDASEWTEEKDPMMCGAAPWDEALQDVRVSQVARWA